MAQMIRIISSRELLDDCFTSAKPDVEMLGRISLDRKATEHEMDDRKQRTCQSSVR
jgi:hypothetical protein